jgi:hypothetical protein
MKKTKKFKKGERGKKKSQLKRGKQIYKKGANLSEKPE